MKKVFSGTLIFLLVGGLSYAIPVAIRPGSSNAANVPSSEAMAKKATVAPQPFLPQKNSLNNLPKAIADNSNTYDKKDSDSNVSIPLTGTERIGRIKGTSYMVDPSKTSVAIQQPSTNNSAENEALRAQLTAMQAQINQLQNELAKKANTEAVQELNNTLDNKLKNYVSASDVAAEIASAQEETLTVTTNKINALNSKVSTVAKDAVVDEGLVKKYFNQFLDTELDKTSDDNKFYRFATKNELNTTKAEIATDVATKKAEAIAAAAADAAEKYDGQINTLNTKITNVASGQIDETALSGHFNKFLNTELGKSDGKFKDFAKTDDVDVAKNAAIAAAEIKANEAKDSAIAAAAADAAEKYDSQINTLNTKITNVASGQIDETALSGHFNKFLNTELGKSDGKFKDFAKTDDVDVAKNAAIAAAEIKANEAKDSAIAAAADSADRKFATSDDIKNFLTADTLEPAIANKKILAGYAKTNDIDTAISGKGFLTADTLEPAIANKKILAGYAKTNDIDTAISGKGFLTADTLEPAIANKKILDGYAKTNDIDTAISGKGFLTADTLEPAIANKKILDGYAKTEDVDVAKNAAIAVAEIKANEAKNSAIAAAADSADRKFATSDDIKNFLTADTLEPAIANKKILDGYAKTNDVNTAINTAKTEAINTAGTVTDTKLANYTPTSGLSDIISNKINTDLTNENSYLAKQFANLEKEFEKYQKIEKIEDTPYEPAPSIDTDPTMEP